MVVVDEQHAQPKSAADAETLIRCLGRVGKGIRCNTVLWAARSTGIRLRLRIRHGEHLTIEVAGPALASLSVLCPRCETRWLPADPWHPLLGSSHGSGGVLKAVSAAS